jgi:hypothetical protein
MLRVVLGGELREEASHFFIRFKNFLVKNLVIVVRVASWGETSAAAFQESDPQPPPYHQSQSRREFTGFKFTFGSEPIIWSNLQLVRTLDIDYAGQLEEQGGGLKDPELYQFSSGNAHESCEAISLVSNPSFSNTLIKICCAASSCGVMIVADTKALTLAG